MFTFSVSACRLWNNLRDQVRTIEDALAELKVVFWPCGFQSCVTLIGGLLAL